MRAELVIDVPTPNRIRVARPLPAARRSLDRYELVLLVAFAAVSLWVLSLDAWQVVVHGRVWTGTDGVYIVDQMQYLAWIRDASRHLLAANLFVLRPTPADYFQPAIAISGVLSALGLAPALSLLLWKPVAVGGIFFATRAVVHRTLTGLWARRAALTLALFYGSVTIAYGNITVLGDLFPGFLSWGYTFGLLSIAAMVGALVVYERDRAQGRTGVWPAVLGVSASLLHPWHGELLALVLIVAELTMWRHGRRGSLTLPLVTLGAIGLSLLYYAILGHADLSWKLAREASKHSFSLWPIAMYLAPLAIPAVLAYRGPSRTFLMAAMRAWPIAALAVFVLSASALGATPLHAFEGITIPLAPLAVQGIRTLRWQRLPRPRLIALTALALATIPGTILQLNAARQLAAPTQGNANFIARDERNALDYLAHRREVGGVLTRSYLGAVVPSRTGRHTLVGDCLWSQPGCLQRTDIAQRLFTGGLAPHAAQRFVRRTGARFVLADCGTQTDLQRLLGPLTQQVARFGCATVYELDPPNPVPGPLTNLRADAAVRAARRQ